MIVILFYLNMYVLLCHILMYLFQEPRVVYGGGAAEIACSLAVSAQANQLADLEQYAFRAYAEALESIPLALAENSGLSAIHALAEIKVFTQLKFMCVLIPFFYYLWNRRGPHIES